MLVPYDGRLIRNLLYHVYPVRGRGVWQWNVSQLLRRMDQFNGQRIVSVVTDDKTDSFETVKAAFKGTVKDFFHHKNDPTLGEVVSFEELLKRVENIDPRQITFYGHAKGVKYQKDSQPMVHRWAEVMYSNLLDYPSLIEDSLRFHPLVGTFLKSGNAFGSLPPSWHYAGTFFWFRNYHIFSQPLWNRIARQWWGVEAWPGVICKKEEADCLLLPGEAGTQQLYSIKYWTDKANSVWHSWQLCNANLRAFSSYREILNTIRSLPSRRLIVTGPQRSGTMITSKILANDLGLPFLSELEFDTHNFEAFHSKVSRNQEFVIQAPTMSAYVHLLPYTVIWVRRNLQDILRSQQRINWNGNEQIERDRYFEHSKEPAATIKTRAWEDFQRIALGERAFDLDYESLKGHPMWVPPEDRKSFVCRQTYPDKRK